MTDATPPSGARFFNKVNRDLGRAGQVTTHIRPGSALTVVDVTGAEPELTRALTMLDRERVRIHCEDAASTCYVFTWASGYANGTAVRMQGMLEPRTGRELEGWTAKAAQPAPTPRPKADSRPPLSWHLGRPKPGY
jgi:hypothetical protein